MIRLQTFTIERFRQFDKVVSISLEPVTLLIGANNSGKTAVLQAMALFQYCLEKCMTRNGKNEISSKWSLKKTENVRPEEFGPLPVATTTDLWPQGKAREAIKLAAEFEGGGTISLEIRQQYNLFKIRPTVANFNDEQLNSVLTQFAIRLIPIFSGLLPREEFLVLPARQERQLALRYGEIVRNLLFSLKRDAPHRYKLLAELLSRVYPDAVLDVEYDEDTAKRLTSARIDSSYRDQILSKDLDLIVAGSGMHQVVQILAGMLQPEVSLVLLDEPDAHLHARLQGALMRVIIELAQTEGLQFVIATHSPQLLRTAPIDSIRICRRASVTKFAPGPDQLELLDQLGALERMELVPLLQSRRIVFVENREDRQLIELFARKMLGAKAEAMLRGLTFLYTYQEPVSANVLDKARQVNDLLKDPSLSSLTGKSAISVLSVGDRDYRTSTEIRTIEKELAQKATQDGFKFAFQLKLWHRTEIENYLLDLDAMCAAIATQVVKSGQSDIWQTLEPEFRAHVLGEMESQKDKATERFAARLQDRDRRKSLTTVMEKARHVFDEDWNGGVDWCDAKRVLSAARKFLQDKGLSPRSLSQASIVEAMTSVPDDVKKLVKLLQAIIRSTTTKDAKSPIAKKTNMKKNT